MNFSLNFDVKIDSTYQCFLSKMDEIVEKIIQGEQVDLSDYYTEAFYDELYQRLKSYTNNGNCMYYAGICFYGKDDRLVKEYLEKAIVLGSKAASYELASFKYRSAAENSKEKENAIEDGLKVLQTGYRNTTGVSFFSSILLRYISVLTAELVEERLRPPEVGGSDYIKAQEHFNTLKK